MFQFTKGAGFSSVTVTVASGIALIVDFTRMTQQLAVGSHGVRSVFRCEHQRPAAIWMWMNADGLIAYDAAKSAAIESGFQSWIASGSPSDTARCRFVLNHAGVATSIDFRTNLQWEAQGATQVK